jgi:hypothetical protein
MTDHVPLDYPRRDLTGRSLPLMRPTDLADELGIDSRQLRGWLRDTYIRPATEKGTGWVLNADQVAAARARFAGRTPRRLAPATAERPAPAQVDGRDWFWEGNVVTAVVRYLKEGGWRIEWVSDTATKEQGDDIRATKDERTLRVEVKGWPTVGYADPARASETKRTRPSTQAGHWYSQALLHVVRDLGRHPNDLVAIALPDWPRFRNLVTETEGPLRRLGVSVLFVREDGSVERRIG